MQIERTDDAYYGAVTTKARELIAEGVSRSDAIAVAFGLVTPPPHMPDSEPSPDEIARVSRGLVR